MGWLGGVELIAGVVALGLGFLLMRLFRFVPQPDASVVTPSATRVALIPVLILFVLVCGIALVMRGVGLI